jgi:hypothetical protein
MPAEQRGAFDRIVAETPKNKAFRQLSKSPA